MPPLARRKPHLPYGGSRVVRGKNLYLYQNKSLIGVVSGAKTERSSMPRLRLYFLMLVGGWFACDEGALREPSALPTISAADSVQLCQVADSLIALAKTDTARTDTLLSEAIKRLTVAREASKWVSAWTERFRYHRGKNNEYLFRRLEEAMGQMWWEEDSLSGRMHAMLGFCLRQMGRNYAAGVHYEKACILSERFGGVTPRNPAGPIYKTLANIKTRLGENEEAEKLLITALRLLQQDTAAGNATANAFTAADIHSDLGLAYQNAGQMQKALAQYNKGMIQLQRLRPQTPQDSLRRCNTLGMLLANKASALMEVGQLTEATQTIQAALATLAPNKYNYRFNALDVQASLWEKIGRHDLANAARQQAMQLADQPQSGIEPREVSKMLIAMGWSALRHHSHDSTALLLAQQALHRLYPRLSPTRPEDNPDPTIFDPDPENAVAEALDLKSEALWQQYYHHPNPGTLELAERTAQLAIEMMENLRDVAIYESSKLLSSQQSRRYFARLFRILYARYSMGELGAAHRAFAASEQSKAILLRQKVSADALLQNAQVADSLILRERDLRDQRAFLKNALFQHLNAANEPDATVTDDLKQQLFQVEKEQAQLREAIAQKHNLSLQHPQVPTTTVAEVRDHLLRPGEWWISYFTDPDSGLVYLLRIDAQGIAFARQPYHEADITDFVALINDLNTAENRSADPQLWRLFTARAHRLYQVLLAPVLPELPRRLALSPDGALALLPFDVLLSQPADVRKAGQYDALDYVGLRVPIRHTLSASLEYFYAQQPRQRPHHTYIGFAPEYVGSSMAPVKDGQKVVDSAAHYLRGRAFCGTAAAVDSFLHYAPRSAILQFYGHAEAFDSFPDYSWLAFTPASASTPPQEAAMDNSTQLSGPPRPSAPASGEHFLFAHQIYHRWLACDVVLLSACRTGAGKIAPGEGVLSLAHAFQAAGCPATVMTLWKVRDDATAQLTQRFLHHLRQGADKDDALLLAKREYLSSAPDAFPYFWAGFVLTGSPTPVRLPFSHEPYAAIVQALMAIIALWWRWQYPRKKP